MDEPFGTSDTTLASYLLVSGFNLQAIDYSQPRFRFTFEWHPRIHKSASAYLSGNALTDPAAFARVNKRLLNTIGHRLQWGDD